MRSDEALEHLQSLFEGHKKHSVTNYTSIQEVIHDRNNIKAQTPKGRADGRLSVSLTPTYLCLQCPGVHTPEARDKHWEVKGHSFCKGDFLVRNTSQADAQRSRRVAFWLSVL